MPTITDQMIAQYRRDGFVVVRDIISKDEAAAFCAEAIAVRSNDQSFSNTAIFAQFVNMWPRNPTMRKIAFHPSVTAAAKTLSDKPLRIWHDQILIKDPHNKRPTEFHQDQPYWPLANEFEQISVWVALVDVPVERGCMTFIAGAQHRSDLRMQNLGDARSLFTICPEMQWMPRVTLPLRAGDCTFHHGRCPHMANANETDTPRVAFACIYTEDGTTYTGMGHPVTDPLKQTLKIGDKLDGEVFPLV